MVCIICGKQIEKSRYSNKDLCSSDCFHINFWNEAKAEMESDPHRNPVIDGTKYHVGMEYTGSFFRGFGGREFDIEFLDGTKVSTTNLWHNGEIPESHKPDMPDNAVFVRK